ncbi:MAG TPA: flagellar basal body L-ring protein FlgH [Bacteroidota bacterium]|nr:flagellar basal body L-ring protein FlgH [Bacteroidota bacterium]
MEKKLILMPVIACLFAANGALSQDLRENLSRSLFSDQKANHVGDAVTILVVESSSASNSVQTSASRASNFSLTANGGMTTANANPLSGASATAGTQNSFAGQGATSSAGSIQAQVSATVDSVLPNGNLYVVGNRTIVINGEEQIIKISGVIRPSDIQTDNSVYSYNISDATIIFKGSGIVSRVQEPGWLTKFFHWIF